MKAIIKKYLNEYIDILQKKIELAKEEEALYRDFLNDFDALEEDMLSHESSQQLEQLWRGPSFGNKMDITELTSKMKIK
jgi:hypothetical protein